MGQEILKSETNNDESFPKLNSQVFITVYTNGSFIEKIIILES